jgi:hypothetical protein
LKTKLNQIPRSKIIKQLAKLWEVILHKWLLQYLRPLFYAVKFYTPLVENSKFGNTYCGTYHVDYIITILVGAIVKKSCSETSSNFIGKKKPMAQLLC